MARSRTAGKRPTSRILTVTWLLAWKPIRRAAPVLLGSYCGCSDSEVVWISRSATPLSLIAASTTVISRALASLAARAVLPWLETPRRIIALSGAAATVPSPVTVKSLSTRSAACAGRERRNDDQK